MNRIFIAPLLSLTLIAAPVLSDTRDEVFEIVEAVSVGEPLSELPEDLHAPEMIEFFYHGRDYQLAWQDRATIQPVLALLGKSVEHGLDPEDYHYSTLRALEKEWHKRILRKDRVRARFDVLLSDAVLLYARHLIQGKVDPTQMESSWNYEKRDFSAERVSQRLNDAISTGTLLEDLESMAPAFAFYQGLQDELKRYQTLAENGAFAVVPTDTVLKAGMRHANVVPLRASLVRLNLLPASDSDHFDEELKAALASIGEARVTAVLCT